MAKKKRFEKWAPKGRVKEARARIDEKPDINFAGGNHFATRSRANDFARLMRALPDIDPVLSKRGKGIPTLRELLADSHLESVWSVRRSTAAGAEWFVEAGAEGAKEKAAAEAFNKELKNLDVPRIIEEMMDAVAYGYSPLEIIWEAREGKWGIGNIVGKPPEWFEFTPENRLVFRTGVTGQEELPENRFLLVQHGASYVNPYGSKVFSKCYWPLTFKKRGWQWWALFVEKYGGAFMYGTYPNNADDKLKADLIDALDRMITDSVAIIPEGTEIKIESLADKKGSSNIHKEFIDTANAEVSKAVLGETLTTEIGDKGSYAAAQTHNLVREDLAVFDRHRISAAFNRLSSVYSFYNYGPEVIPPLFQFVQDEDLQKERAERDAGMYQFGWRPRKGYFIKQYGMEEEDFDVAGDAGGAAFGDRAAVTPYGREPGCSCGLHSNSNLFGLFASEDEKRAGKDGRLMGEFAGLMLPAGQEEINRAVESYADALGTVNNYKDAARAIQEVYKKRDAGTMARLIGEVRYAASGIGGARRRRGKSGN